DGCRLAVNSAAPVVNVWTIATDGPVAGAARLNAVLRRATGEHAWFAGSTSDVSEWSRRFHLERIKDAELSGAWDYGGRGVGYFHVGDDGRAKTDLSRAVALNPLAGLRLYECGLHALERRQWDRAAAYFGLGVAVTPADTQYSQYALTAFAY